MRKRKRIQGGSEQEIPMSSMIDVVFLILIYFILIQQPILDETLLKTNLPEPDAPSRKIKMITPTVIDVFEEEGDFYRFNGRAYENKVLYGILKDIADNDPEKQIIINCGANAEHQKLVKLLDKCAEVNLKNLNLVNDDSRPLKK